MTCMALPESLRPRARRGAPPPPPKGGRWAFVIALAVVAVGVPAWVVLSRLGREEGPGRQRIGEQFIQAIVAGTASPSGGGATGFESAWRMLAPELRESLPFDVFFETWSRTFDERGFVVDHVRVTDQKARGTREDPISYLLFLGGEGQDHAKLETVRLDLVLARRDDRFTIARYTLTDVPNPRAAR
jgi:hypothetical protein